MFPRKLYLSAVAALALATPALASDEFTPAMEGYLASNIATWATDPVILDALRAANARTAGYTPAQIDALDLAWRSEVGAADTPTITPVLNNAAADFLKQKMAASGGAIAEIFIMDSVGLNVAATGPTSDMWQGDEEKFTETYGIGADAFHISDVELDESTQTYQGQISLAIADPATGDLLGAMTVGVDPLAVN